MGDFVICDQARTIEDNCNKEFKLKYDRHLENVKEQYKTKLKDMEEENAELQEKIKTIQVRVSESVARTIYRICCKGLYVNVQHIC